MGAKHFRIVIAGRVLPGGDRTTVVHGLAKRFRLSDSRAQELLSGRATRLSQILSGDAAEQVRRKLSDLGVECRLEPVAQEPNFRMSGGSTAATAANAQGSGLTLESQRMRCPRCGHDQPQAEICCQCGIVISKFSESAPRRNPPRTAPKPQSGFPHHTLNRVFQLLFLFSLALTAWSYSYKDRLPPADFYDREVLGNPRQTASSSPVFSTDVNGIRYTIRPVANYELHGVVVSYHDSDAFIDVYHHKDWKDFINIRDICVIWGDNVVSEVYRELVFENTTWTCWVYWPSHAAASRFKSAQFSNNHLLADDPLIHQAIMAAEPGDHIAFRGMLASYSHSNGKFQRGTSTRRTDTGNGACETVFVEDFRIVKKANSGWRRLYVITGIVALISLLGIIVMLFIAPVRR